MKALPLRVVAWFTLSLTLPNGLCALIAQELSRIQTSPASVIPDLDIDTGRPLNEALSSLEQSLHIPINYEEIIITDPAQMVASKKLGLRPGYFYPKGGKLKVHFGPEKTSALDAIKTVLNANNQADLPGPYTFVSGNGSITVFPASYPSLFNRKISFPVEARTMDATVQQIATQIAQVSHETIVVLNEPPDINHFKITLGAESETVAKVFEKLTGAIGPTSFRFIYDLASKTYYLNLQGVSPAAPEAAAIQSTPLIHLDQSETLKTSPWFTKTNPEISPAAEPVKKDSESISAPEP